LLLIIDIQETVIEIDILKIELFFQVLKVLAVTSRASRTTVALRIARTSRIIITTRDTRITKDTKSTNENTLLIGIKPTQGIFHGQNIN
jgi:hypothetical protein